MNTPNPFIEEAVNELEEMFGIVGHGFNSDPQSKKYAQLSKLFRSKLTLALEEGERKGRIDEADKCEEHIKVAREKGEATGRKTDIDLIQKSRTLHEKYGIGTKEQMARNQAIEDILQASK